jgi:O-antigen/teichoic acid export membrane protein
MVTAPEAVPVLLGPQWGPAIRPLQILCLAGFLRVFVDISGAPLKGLGFVRPLLLAQAAQFVGIAVVCWLVAPSGLVAVSCGIVGVTAGYCAMVVTIISRQIHFKAPDYFRSAGVPVLLNVVACSAGYFLRAWLVAWHLAAPLVLGGTVAGIAVLYLAALQFTGLFPLQTWRKTFARA